MARRTWRASRRALDGREQSICAAPLYPARISKNDDRNDTGAQSVKRFVFSDDRNESKRNTKNRFCRPIGLGFYRSLRELFQPRSGLTTLAHGVSVNTCTKENSPEGAAEKATDRHMTRSD